MIPAWFALLTAAVGLFLSLWIVVPAPIPALLPLSVGTPEVSPWLVALTLFALGLALIARAARVALVFSLLGLALSALPLVQLPATAKQFADAMRLGLGDDYEALIPAPIGAKLRTTPFDLADSFRGIAPGSVPVRSRTGIVFAAPGGAPLHLNVHRPVADGRHPTVVVIYGGSWQRGSPEQEEWLCRTLASRGWTAIAIDYRHAPAFRFPAQLDDVRAALAFVRTRADEYGVDPKRLVLLGHSAGAHLAMLAAYSPGGPPVAAVVSYYGPIDLAEGYNDPPEPDPIDVRRTLETFIGGPPEQFAVQYRRASPATFAERPQPPTLLIYGSRDNIVEAKFARRLYERLRAAGNRAVLLEIPWSGHAFDAVFSGPGNQLALYYTERFLAWSAFRAKQQ